MLRLLLGIFMCLCVGGLLVGLVRGPVDPKAAPSVTRIIISALTFQGAILALTWRFLREQKSDWNIGFGLKRDSFKAVRLGLLAIGVFLPLAWGLQFISALAMKAVGIEPAEQLALVALRNSGSAIQLMVMGLVTILLAPVAEEILFRGVLYPTARQYGFPRAALWGSSILFAVIHFNIAAFTSLLLLALLLVWLYEKTDNLLAPITAHVAFNAINFVMFFVLKDLPQKIPAQS